METPTTQDFREAMDGFETISLESTECDICHQDTGEELISCVLNDRCLRESENLKLSCSGNVAKVHQSCLQKWESVMKNAIKPLQHQIKRTWKDRLKGLINTTSDGPELIETWAPVNQSRCRDCGDENLCVDIKTAQNSRCQGASFLTNEAYRVETLYRDENRTRGRKVRIKSIELEKEDDDENKNSKSSVTQEPSNRCPLEKHSRDKRKSAVKFVKVYKALCFFKIDISSGQESVQYQQ